MEDFTFWKEPPSFYAGDELHAWKQNKMRAAMVDNGLDALVFTRSDSIRYATDFYAKGYRPFMDFEYFMVFPKDGEPVVAHTSGSDNYRIQIKSDIKDHRKVSGPEKWDSEISKILSDYGLESGRIGVDLLPFQMHAGLKERHPKLEIVDASGIWTELLVEKHPVEIALIRESLSIVEIGLYASFEAIKPGVREYEVAAAAEYAMRNAGSEMIPFLTNVASGPNSSIFERFATERRIRNGELVIVDMGAVHCGYTGDLGRTVAVGKPSALQKEIYQVTHESIQAAIETVRPGVTLAKVDAAAREAIATRGYAKYEHKFTTGHQLGWGLHGEPLVNRGVDYPLRPGMIICLEPRVTLVDQPSVGGAHLEEAVLVTETGHELLSHVKFDEQLLQA